MDSVKPPSRLLYTKWSSLTLPIIIIISLLFQAEAHRKHTQTLKNIALLSQISNIKPSQSNQTERPAYRMTLAASPGIGCPHQRHKRDLMLPIDLSVRAVCHTECSREQFKPVQR